ncbi:Rtf2 RING-finger protein [Rhizoctonia solani AG-3 Rhs1AP]|uniref:Rtf2 RING-finger protein n=1 Tax=Rhizoctonia solani AG-3 Rhs1AP TaxID=1086054 RepID=X8JRG3_9AGAM|nr:Rtf2 RING-finger protein [Rhizoctonia solani AG-3 Rhs1AP]
MGNDGGSIPDRRDLVRTKAKAEQADKNNLILAAWFFCALSKRPLQEPIVSCVLGKLYNKDAMIEFLLDRSAYGDGEEICGHVKSLKDVKQLKLTPNPAMSTSQQSDKPRSAFVCPLTLKEMTGSLPFSYLAPCGCVFSTAGLKAVAKPTEEKDKAETATATEKEPCPQCGKKFTNKSAAVGGDIRTINPEPEEAQKMLEFAPTKATKKRKVAPVADAEADESKEKPKKAKTEAASINASMGITRAVANELAAAEKARKATMSSAVQSLYQGKDGVNGRGSKDTFLTRGTFTRVSLALLALFSPCTNHTHSTPRLSCSL